MAHQDQIDPINSDIDFSLDVAKMGGLVEKSLADSILALRRRDEILAKSVVGGDRRIDELEDELVNHAMTFLTQGREVAEVREVVGTIRIASDLERIGDLAKNIGKRVVAIGPQALPQSIILGFENLTDEALSQLKDALDSYVRRDAERAFDVWHRDADLDQLFTSVFREILEWMTEDPKALTVSTHLLFAAKNIERIGDHTTNIAETVVHIATGKPIAFERPKNDTSSLLRIQPA